MTPSNEDLHFYQREIRPEERSSLSVLAGMVPPGSQVLDLGCGSGALGLHLSATRGCTCDGVTLNQAEATHAQAHYRRVEVADLETASLPTLFAGRHYDAIVCADVLEHLRRPEHILQACKSLLKPDGRLLISVPNAAYAGLTLELMHGEFRYRPEGLLDQTHLRFFTRRSLQRLLQDNGWAVNALQAIRRELWDSEFQRTPDSLPPAFTRYLLALPDALSYQFVASVRPTSAPASAIAPPVDAAPDGAAFTAQLYWGQAGAYDESRKTIASGTIGSLRQTLRFELPACSMDYPGLRLDPADRPGFLHLHRLRLCNAESQTLWHWTADAPQGQNLSAQPQNQIAWAPAPASAPGTVLLLLTGDDPWMELPIPTSLLAQCMHAGPSVLEVELGWPMSADYLALAQRTQALQAQAAHTEHTLAQLQTTHHQARQELARLHPLAQEHAQLQHLHHLLQNEVQQLQAQMHMLENSRVMRATRPIARLKRQLAHLMQGNTPAAAPAAAQPAPPANAPTQPAPQAAPDSMAQTAADTQTPAAVHTPQTGTPAAVVDIIIPVYQGLADTQRCLASVLGSRQHTATRIIVINDACPNPELTDWLRQQAQQEPRITLLENAENLGFVHTVNRGMALSADNDVLLLNSDTEVAGDWLDRLRQAAYRESHTGTVTPLSNNATICSYPRFCADNPLPPGQNTASLDALCAHTNAGMAVPIPTAVGFCMYIRRDCLAQTGPFDADHFGTGYGEENDFCMRAARHGWQHLLAVDTFVRHVGGVSFGAAKSPREAAAQAILQQLHPDYEATVQAHLAQDPARAWREALDIARLNSSPHPRILAVLHGVGGGTRRHVHELSAHLQGRAHFLTLTPLADHRLRLQWDAPGEAFTRDYHGLEQADELLALLRNIGVAHVHYHHLLGLHPDLMRLPEQLQVTYDFTAHDYYNACPQIALVDENHAYCGERGVAQCTECLCGRPAPTGETIEDWRLRHRLFLNGARAVLAPSRDAAQRMAHYFPAANIRHAPHLDIAPGTPLPQPGPRRLSPGANLRVFVVGALSRIKGGETLEIVSLEAARLQAPIELHLLGYPHLPMRQQPHASLTVHGAYEDADLPLLLARLQPDLIWFPARWPETYSYTLSACLQAGLPIIATDLGAFPERLAGRPWSWIHPWNTPPGDWLALLLELRARHYVGAEPPLPAPGLHIPLPDDTLPAWSYDSDYLAGLVPPDESAPQPPPTALPATP